MTASLLEKVAALFSGRKPAVRTQRKKLFLTTKPDLVYAIGDVHGCYDLLHTLEQKIIADAAPHTGSKLIVMLGDYIDRGPQSAKVISHLLGPPPDGFERVCLAGNHEQMLIDFIAAPRNNQVWLNGGGKQTLNAYGISSEVYASRSLGSKNLDHALSSHIPDEHLEFLENLPALLAMPGFVFVHAGLRSQVALTAQKDSDLLWIRDEFLAMNALEIPQLADLGLAAPLRIVHGHTPSGSPVETPVRIGIDTGAFASEILTAVRIGANASISFMSSK